MTRSCQAVQHEVRHGQADPGCHGGGQFLVVLAEASAVSQPPARAFPYPAAGHHRPGPAHRAPAPTAALGDSPSVQTGGMSGAERGCDGGKRGSGRTRHRAVDTAGWPMPPTYTTVRVPGPSWPRPRPGGPACLGRLGLHGPALGRVHAQSGRLRTGSQPTPSDAQGVSVVLHRGVGERTCGGFHYGRCRAQDCERRVESAVTPVQVASIGIMLRRWPCLTLCRYPLRCTVLA